MDWSFVGLDGKTARVTPENVAALTRDVAAEINAALDAHVKAAEKEAADPNAKAAGATS